MKREYGIDLLKMLAMLMVVTHHILNAGLESKLYDSISFFPQYVFAIFHCLCYCAVDVFIMATGYILCRLEFKYIRIFKLWRQVTGYSFVIVIIGYFIMGGIIHKNDLLKALFPVLTNQYWFFTQYFALFFTIPFLNRLMDNLTRKEIGLLLMTGFCLLSVIPILAGRDLFVTKWGYCCLWFMYLYCVGSTLFKLDVINRIKTGYAFIGLSIACLISGAGAVASSLLPKLIGCGGRLGEFANSYTSPSIVFEAVSLFILCGKIHINETNRFAKFIMLCAPSTFIVYVIHSNTFFRKMVGWDTIFIPLADYGILCSIMGSILSALVVFGLIVLIDALWRYALKYIEQLIHANN